MKIDPGTRSFPSASKRIFRLSFWTKKWVIRSESLISAGSIRRPDGFERRSGSIRSAYTMPSSILITHIQKSEEFVRATEIGSSKSSRFTRFSSWERCIVLQGLQQGTVSFEYWIVVPFKRWIVWSQRLNFSCNHFGKTCSREFLLRNNSAQKKHRFRE